MASSQVRSGGEMNDVRGFKLVHHPLHLLPIEQVHLAPAFGVLG
jgi:hypothetical protein